MKNLKSITAIVLLLLSFTACKKDKNDAGASGSNYQYNSKTYAISSANEKHISGDIFLEFTSGSGGDYLQIAFADVSALPQGSLTYHADRFSGYNAGTNFWVSGVGLAGANTAVTGGTVTITKDGDSYKIDINLTTANGPITGSYSGKPTVTN
jgi:hypothetical protein